MVRSTYNINMEIIFFTIVFAGLIYVTYNLNPGKY